MTFTLCLPASALLLPSGAVQPDGGALQPEGQDGERAEGEVALLRGHRRAPEVVGPARGEAAAVAAAAVVAGEAGA